MTKTMQPLRRPISHATGHAASSHPAAHASGDITRADQLEYLADLILELKEIADNLECATLAGLLVVAHRESVIQARDR